MGGKKQKGILVFCTFMIGAKSNFGGLNINSHFGFEQRIIGEIQRKSVNCSRPTVQSNMDQ